MFLPKPLTIFRKLPEDGQRLRPEYVGALIND